MVNIIDTTPPIGIISYPLDSTTYTSNISKLEFTATDINLAKCEYSTDNGVTKNVVACTSGVLTTIALNSTEGANKWDIYLRDSSGNIFNSAVNFIVNSSIPPTPPIDSTPPLINILGPVNGTTYTSNVSFLNFIATDINLAKCEYSTDNGITKNVVACTSGVLTTIALNSTEGVNKWIVYAEDNAGNTNSNYTEFIVNSSLVDITPPVINVISPENNKEYKTKEITLKLITDENARVLFSLDNKANITMNNPNDHIFTYELSLSDKAHELIFLCNR